MSRIRIGTLNELDDGDLHAVDADGTAIIVGRAGDQICAARNHCPHLGLSLTKGPGGKRYADGDLPVAQLAVRPGHRREPRLDARLRRAAYAALVPQADRARQEARAAHDVPGHRGG